MLFHITLQHQQQFLQMLASFRWGVGVFNAVLHVGMNQSFGKRLDGLSRGHQLHEHGNEDEHDHDTGIARLVSVIVSCILMQDDLSKVAATILLGRRTVRMIQTNIGFALGVKAIFRALAVTGHATLWMAILADTGATLIVIANALRLLRG